MNATVLDFIQFYVLRGGACPIVLIEEDSNGQPAYIGIAARGSATSSAVWQVIRYTKTGLVTTIDSSLKNQIWDNRTSLTYA